MNEAAKLVRLKLPSGKQSPDQIRGWGIKGSQDGEDVDENW